MNETTSDSQPFRHGRLLIVDDDASSRLLMQSLLGEEFIVQVAPSGEDALNRFEADPPDLVFLDVEMPGINGFETCRRMHEFDGSIPVIFVTMHDSQETRLEAFDSGADDIIIKPVDGEVLKRKARLAIRRKTDNEQLIQEKNSLQQMAMNFLSSVGENGVLLNFMRSCFNCGSIENLANNLIEATHAYGLECQVLIRHGDGATTFKASRAQTPLEEVILERTAHMGRIVRFRKRLVINYDRVTVMVTNLPVDDETKLGRVRDHVAILTETAEAFTEGIEMREAATRKSEFYEITSLEVSAAIETLHTNFRNTLGDTESLVDALEKDLEGSYSDPNMTDQQKQAIGDTVKEFEQRIRKILDRGKKFEQQFELVFLEAKKRKS
jgi:CheY-like chemotaxis protein